MTNPNDRAFGSANFWGCNPGLTKREYFAAMAMQGMLADSTNHDITFAETAMKSKAMADALITELNKENLKP